MMTKIIRLFSVRLIWKYGAELFVRNIISYTVDMEKYSVALSKTFLPGKTPVEWKSTNLWALFSPFGRFEPF